MPAEDPTLDHHVPADLLELYEVLEFEGLIEVPPIPRGASASPDKLVSRAAWGARPPKSSIPLITGSDEGNTCHYEGPAQGTFSHDSCATKVRGIQRFHMDSRGWADIAYNSMVCPHGYIFEGRWFGKRSAANGTNEGNNRSYAHCALIGQGDEATADLKLGLAKVRTYFEAEGSGSKIWSHRDWKATACPGDPLNHFVKVERWAVTQPAPAQETTVSVTAALPLLQRDHPNAKQVKMLQSILKEKFNQSIVVDGIYGDQTIIALQNVQRYFGLPESGMTGEADWKLLLEIS